MKTILMVGVAVCCLSGIAWADPAEPASKVEVLVNRLKSGKLAGALVDFFAGSLLAKQKEMELRAMDAQAKSAFEFYGNPTSYEIVETSKMGNCLTRIKWITKHKDETPIFWNTLFYRRNNNWEPMTIIFFDDPDKAGFR